MKRTKLRRTLLFLIALLSVYAVVLVVLEPHTLSANIANQDKPKQELTFDKVVQPFFANHCYHCHDEDLRTAGLNLGAFDSAASLTKDPATLKLILEKLSTGQMPPRPMPRPKPAEIVAVTKWLAHQLGSTSETNNDATGVATDTSSSRVTVRRLNRVEYDNTVRDLLGVDGHASDDFPQDDSGYGFDNIGDVLSLSPVLMEKYLAAAEKISRTAIFGNEPMKPTLVGLRSGQRNQKPQMTPLTDYDLTGLSMPNSFHTTYRFPVDGEYVLRVNLGGDRPPGSEALQLALWIDGKRNQQIQVDPATIASFATASEPQQLWGIKTEFRVTLTSRRSLACGHHSTSLRRPTGQLQRSESIQAPRSAASSLQATAGGLRQRSLKNTERSLRKERLKRFLRIVHASARSSWVVHMLQPRDLRVRVKRRSTLADT